MFPDTPYAPAVGSFGRPVPVPGSGPSDSPTKTIEVSCAWLPYIRGALLQLVLQATWQADGDLLTATQMQAMTLISLFGECSSGPPAWSCDYPFNAVDGQGFVAVTDTNLDPTNRGEFDPLNGWLTTNAHDVVDDSATTTLWIKKPLGATFVLTRSILIYDLTKGTFDHDPGNTNGTGGYLGGSFVGGNYVDGQTDPDGTGKILVWEAGGVSIDTVDIQLKVSGFSGSGIGDGGGRAVRLVLQGMSANPCG